MEKYVSNSVKETKNFAINLIEQISAVKSQKTLVIGLVGELGAGKTQFVQGAAEYLGIKRNVTSPTFVLMKKYSVPTGNFNTMYHIDCYRLHSSREVLDLGWKEIAQEPNNIIFIEWAERVKGILLKDVIWVTIKDKGENKREIEVRN